MNKNKKKSWRLIQLKDGIGKSREYCKQHGLISSLITKKNYHSCIKCYLDWRDFNNLPRHQQDKSSDLTAFLEELAEIRMQNTIEHYRCALSLVFSKKLPFVKSDLPNKVSSRNYFLSEILLIIKSLSEKNAISILLCYFAGLRAHELSTLRRIGEIQKTMKRNWSDERFAGIENFRLYLVRGKGGLVREVAIPLELAVLLEKRRLDIPKIIIDRGVKYLSYYDLAAGKALSEAFSRSSKKVLNWCCGLHGTRHSYAQNRLFKLLKLGLEYEYALRIVSEELGHFRPSITLCYLR